MKKLLCLTCVAAFGAPALAASVTPMSSERRANVVPTDSTQFGVKLGATSVKRLGATTGTYGAYVDHAVADNLLLGGTIDYWNKASGSLGSANAEVSDIALGLDAKFVFTDTHTAFRPYALAGVTAHRFAIKEVKGSDNGKIDQLDAKYKDVNGKFGLDYGAGVMYRVEPAMDVVGEVRYRPIMDPGVDLGQLAISGGLAYSL